MGVFEMAVAIAGIAGGCGLGATAVWSKMKYGAQLAARGDGLAPLREIELLSNENGVLKGQVSRLEERISVLERIATDPALRTARDIERLR
jgi:hypothetical protein